MGRYQNCLKIDGTNPGTVLTRWLVEFATQVLGWTLHDNNHAGWTNTIGTGADAATTTNADELDFSGSAYTLTAADEGRYVTMLGNAGWSAAEKETIGIYRILKVDATAEIAYLDIQRGVHENGLPLSKSSVSFRIWDYTVGPAINTWAILRTAYTHTPSEPNMDFKITMGSATNKYPFVAVGPFGTWNSTSHAWNDSRNTADRAPSSTATFSSLYVTAYGDEVDKDNLVVCLYISSGNTLALYYLGALTPLAGTTVDTNPGVTYASWCYGDNAAMGYGGNLDDGGRMMAYNGGTDDVEVTAYLCANCHRTGDNGNSVYGPQKMWSQWSKRIYRCEVIFQSRTSSHMEFRGMPKNFWFSGYTNRALMPFGTSLEYHHVNCGISIPWNGSKTHVQWDS